MHRYSVCPKCGFKIDYSAWDDMYLAGPDTYEPMTNCPVCAMRQNNKEEKTNENTSDIH